MFSFGAWTLSRTELYPAEGPRALRHLVSRRGPDLAQNKLGSVNQKESKMGQENQNQNQQQRNSQTGTQQPGRNVNPSQSNPQRGDQSRSSTQEPSRGKFGDKKEM